MPTPYSKKNGDFSNMAHLAAQTQLYPPMFNVPLSSLSFEDTLLDMNKRGAALDGEMAIDRIVKVKARDAKIRLPLIFTIQERFRRLEYMKYKDITITEWNTVTNLPSELYKITANFFLYGFFDDRNNRFVEAIAVDVPTTLAKICNGTLAYYWPRPNPRSKQTFMAIGFDALERSGCVMYRLKPPARSAQKAFADLEAARAAGLL